jgi:tight adherence protein B
MSLTTLLMIIYATAALVVAAILLVVRDLRASRQTTLGETGIDVTTLLPTPGGAVRHRDTESWLGRLVADIRYGFTEETALMLAILVGLVLGGAAYLWRDDPLIGAAGGVFGVFAVGLWLLFLRARRFRALREQLPDVMELMARAVRAGESLDQAIIMAGESGMHPVDVEFSHCASQMRSGLSLELAIRRLVDRAPLVEMQILSMALIVQRRRGGSLPTTLERLAHVFRDRSHFYRQFRAATAAGRGSAAVIALVAIGLDAFVLLGQSEYAQNLVETNVGRVLVAVSLLLQFIGITWALWLFRARY